MMVMGIVDSDGDVSGHEGGHGGGHANGHGKMCLIPG